MTYVIARYRDALRWAIRHRVVTVGVVVFMIGVGNYLAFGGAIGSEFLPHLDEGALWVRGTLAPSTGPGRRHTSGEPGASRAFALFRKYAMSGASGRWNR